MKNNNKTKGTIYLQGPQSRMHQAITSALNIAPEDTELTYDISVDLYRTWGNKDLTIRVDYVYPGRNGH